MGAPLNHLQQITGHSPIRYIGTDDLKHFYFAAENYPFRVSLNVKVTGINFDYTPFKTKLASGSFTPAIRDLWSLKSFTSGNIRGELTDYPSLKYEFTGGPVASPRDVPQLKSTISGFDYAIATELGYIQFSKFYAVLDDYWHDKPGLAQTFSGSFMPYKQDRESTEFFFLTGEVRAEHVPSKVEHVSDMESFGERMNFFFLTGKYQG